jgi:plasmid maintenance system antidote protein VapI
MLSWLLNQDAGITPEMAPRIEQWLGVEGGGRADVLLGMQLDYDLWHARKHAPKSIKRAPAEATALFHLVPCRQGLSNRRAAQQ